jgi:polyisoprenoid-binding protein YceI
MALSSGLVHRRVNFPILRIAMNKMYLASIATLLYMALATDRLAVADTWSLPSQLNDTNTKVSFVVDSTWHTVNGTTKDLSGSVVLKDKHDPLSIVVDLKIQVKTFDTDWDSRDEMLQECMASETYPVASFTSTRLSENCKPAIIDISGKCSGTLTGIITMRDVSKEVALPVSITKEQNSYLISGSLPVTWADYNIEDPSILIAKLDPIVTISYETKVPLKR